MNFATESDKFGLSKSYENLRDQRISWSKHHNRRQFLQKSFLTASSLTISNTVLGSKEKLSEIKKDLRILADRPLEYGSSTPPPR